MQNNANTANTMQNNTRITKQYQYCKIIKILQNNTNTAKLRDKCILGILDWDMKPFFIICSPASRSSRVVNPNGLLHNLSPSYLFI